MSVTANRTLDPVSRRSRGQRRLDWLALVFGYSLLAVVVTWPLVAHLSSAVPHDLGDPLLSTSLLWWNAHVLPLTSRWWDGFAFFPAHGTMAFSDHRLGESLIASPLQWLGCSPVTAYNLTLLATFPLCAVAAHALAFTLTGRHDAALIAGLAFGFNPFRIAHLEHLELLAGFGMAFALAALHRYRRSRHFPWLAAFALALLVQGLCTMYYLLFFGVMLLLWISWFVDWRQPRLLLAIVAASTAVGVVLSPIAIDYTRIHHAYGFARSFGEVTSFSADLTSFVTASPLSALWGWTSPWNSSERQLFAGLTSIVLAITGAIIAARRQSIPVDRIDGIAMTLWGVMLVFIAIAVATAELGPWRVALGPIVIAGDVFYKPMSVAMAAFAGSVLLSSPVRAAWRRRSPLAFYLLAAVVLLGCSLGPKPAFRGTQVLYEPPYAWLMRLPLFGSAVRVPARFGMVAALSLATAGALGFNRLGLCGGRRRLVAAVFAVGAIADGWVTRFPLAPVPELWPIERAATFGAVLELPVGNYLDGAAMYRATQHHRPLINGTSGYFPPHWRILAWAAEEGDLSVLDGFAGARPDLLVVIDKRADSDNRWRTFFEQSMQARPVADQNRWSLFGFSPRRPPPACDAPVIPIASVSDRNGRIDTRLVAGNNPRTGWSTGNAQRAGDYLTIDLGDAHRPCGVLMNAGEEVGDVFPRRLSIATSVDGAEWTVAFHGSASAQAVLAAIHHPTDAWLEFNVPHPRARFIRLQLEASDPIWPWVVTGLRITGH